ncbi:MAG: hypothetical protein HP046_14480 [Parabacteroides sp.]|nr:hypothetical protein [Parabacteroides sp.]
MPRKAMLTPSPYAVRYPSPVRAGIAPPVVPVVHHRDDAIHTTGMRLPTPPG